MKHIASRGFWQAYERADQICHLSSLVVGRQTAYDHLP
jgi:hypothetical protein